MNNETEPRDGGFTEEELKSQKPFEQYDAWLKWWQEMLPKQDT